MSVRRLILMLLALLALESQGQKRFFDGFNRYLDKRDSATAAKLDSNYIGYYSEKLLFSGGVYSSGGWMKVTNDNGSYELGSDLSNSLSLRACYRGVSICMGLNPFDVMGKNDAEFDISFYGDKMVLDFVYQNSESMSGHLNTTGQYSTEIELEKGFVNRRTMTFGAMYVFNSHRFSYAAAFDQTCIQKRSCGSLLLGAHYLYKRLRFDFSGMGLGNLYTKSKMIGIGAGYAYNLVLPKQWLVSMSGLAEVGVWTKNRSLLSQEMLDIYNFTVEAKGAPDEKITDKEISFSYDHPPIFFIPRLAVIHHFGHFFAGFTSLGSMNFEKQKGAHNYNFVFVSNLMFGIRL